MAAARLSANQDKWNSSEILCRLPLTLSWLYQRQRDHLFFRVLLRFMSCVLPTSAQQLDPSWRYWGNDEGLILGINNENLEQSSCS
jgi:hypothetical protein